MYVWLQMILDTILFWKTEWSSCWKKSRVLHSEKWKNSQFLAVPCFKNYSALPNAVLPPVQYIAKERPNFKLRSYFFLLLSTVWRIPCLERVYICMFVGPWIWLQEGQWEGLGLGSKNRDTGSVSWFDSCLDGPSGSCDQAAIQQGT